MPNLIVASVKHAIPRDRGNVFVGQFDPENPTPKIIHRCASCSIPPKLYRVEDLSAAPVPK